MISLLRYSLVLTLRPENKSNKSAVFALQGPIALQSSSRNVWVVLVCSFGMKYEKKPGSDLNLSLLLSAQATFAQRFSKTVYMRCLMTWNLKWKILGNSCFSQCFT